MILNWHKPNIFSLFVAIIFVMIFTLPIFAQSSSNPSGLEVPRFASTRSKPINVRVGPGKRYDIAWIYVKSGIPIEVIAEFDVWRKIRDHEKEEGWIHQSLVSSARAGLIKSDIDENVSLLSKAEVGAIVKAFLGAEYPLILKSCDGKWCEVVIKYSDNGEKEKTISGYLEQSKVWGVYENEKFD